MDDAIAIKCSICDESFDNQPSKYLVHKLIHHTSIQQQKHLVRLLNNADLKSEETFCMNETFYNVLISLKRIPNPIKPELVNIDEEEHFYPPEPEIMTIPFVEKIEPIFDETIEAKEPNLKEESSKKEELCSLPSNQCPICLKMFANKYTLSTHFKTIHSEEANVKTTTKLKNRSERDALKKTKDDTQIPVTEDHSGEVATEVSVHKCEFCPLTFTRLKYYESHTRRHIERNAIYRKKRQTKKHLCNVCGKRFQEAYDLKMHLYVHSDERPLSCDICGKGFVIKATLRMHMLIHTGEKPHVCNVDGCGRTFKHASGKRQHYNSAHSNVKPFSCEQCKKTFTRKSHLTEHTRNHTGERPFSCEFCGMFFKLSSTLLAHRKTHTNDRRFKCKLCNKAFIKSYSLKTHMAAKRSCVPVPAVAIPASEPERSALHMPQMASFHPLQPCAPAYYHP